jgi:site-specific DNA-methyltransferase (adenine-specific)
VWRVLKPGGHLLAFGGTRTWHRLAVAIEDAGFDVRDSMAWMYGSGFPKSLDVSKAIDKVAGHWRGRAGEIESDNGAMSGANYERTEKGDPITEAAKQWQGWGTALKPAFEPVVVARKPLIGTVAENVQQYGTGALNIDGCRIETDEVRVQGSQRSTGATNMGGAREGGKVYDAGRWPANVILDESQAAELNRQSGVITSAPAKIGKPSGTTFGGGEMRCEEAVLSYGDTGGASRFFYTAKASSAERPNVDGVAHPTVKPLELMQYLVRLVTPPGGTVLEPFAGSGTTAEACIVEGFKCIAIEMTDEYLPLIVQRISKPIEMTLL